MTATGAARGLPSPEPGATAGAVAAEPGEAPAAAAVAVTAAAQQAAPPESAPSATTQTGSAAARADGGSRPGDSPTTPMAWSRPRLGPATLARPSPLEPPVPASPVGASAGGISARRPALPAVLAPGWLVALWRTARRRTAPRPGGAAGPDARATGPVRRLAVTLPRLSASCGGSPVPTGMSGPLAGATGGVLLGFLALLAVLAVRGFFGAGLPGGVGFVLSVLAAAGLCVVATRARPVLRRFRGRDDLTGLLGRRSFLEVASRVVGGGEHRAREAGPAALVLVDLDRFREINSVLGHESGDRLLLVVTRRLRALLQPADLLARIGGDEFAVLLRDAGPGRAELLASRLRDALRAPVLIADMPVQTEVSVGIAYSPAHGRGAAELLRHAEAAMYEAKQTRAGQRTYQRGRHAPSAPGRARLRLRTELRGALENNQIELRYQPKADPRTGRVSGLEALVRWQHPREGLRGPGVFLPEMEQAGLMPALTDRVLELALADCALWHAAGTDLSVSVNVPPAVIDDKGFAERVRAALRRHRLPPRALVVEVTEEALITVREQARRTLAELRALGVRVSLDDYGTGFCSLAYLRELPADEVKLDQMFLRDMHRDASAAEIVRSTVALAHALDLKIVAEGVETRTAWSALASWRCDEVQGYFVSPPLAGGRVLTWMTDWSTKFSRAQAARLAQAATERRPERASGAGGHPLPTAASVLGALKLPGVVPPDSAPPPADTPTVPRAPARVPAQCTNGSGPLSAVRPARRGPAA